MQNDDNELDNDNNAAEIIPVRREIVVTPISDDQKQEAGLVDDMPEEPSDMLQAASDVSEQGEASMLTDTEPPTTPAATAVGAGTSAEPVTAGVDPKHPVIIGDNAETSNKAKWLVFGSVIVVVVLLLVGGAWWLLRNNQFTDSSYVVDQSNTIYSQGAAITLIEGTVEINTGDGWNSTTSGVSLSQGDQLRTAKDSRAIVTLDEGSAIRLDASSSIAFMTLNVGDVLIDNMSGYVYTRVVPSETRTFVVTVDTAPYRALGTAYMTVNEADKKGVEVYESTVTTKDSSGGDQEVSQGEAFYSKDKDPSDVDNVKKLDFNKLKSNTFLKWNKQQDEKNEEFAKRLGVLSKIDEPTAQKEDNKEEAVEQDDSVAAEPTTTGGISAWGAKADGGIKVSWSVSGVDTSNGYKVTYSKTDTTPSYGENSAQYVAAGSSSVVLGLKDGKTWHIRVCAYRGDGKCDSYSNTVSVTAPYVELAKVTRGTMTVSRDGTTLSWSYSGKAIYGYKVVWNTSGEPTYPTSGNQSGAKYLSSKYSSSMNLAEAITKPGEYYLRVCAYTNGTQAEACVDYGSAAGTYVVD